MDDNNKLRNSYGTITLQKGTILYHSSNKELINISPEFPVLFTTLHPSEYGYEGNFITTLLLKRDVTLLFMVEVIQNDKIYSVLHKFLGNSNTQSNMAKMDKERIKCWIPYLNNENLDGWFTSIENKSAVEFAILSDPSILKIIEHRKLEENSWKDMNITKVIPEIWNILYPIVINGTTSIHLNSRFKPQITQYIKYVKQKYTGGTVFSILLENAIITYFDAPIEDILWCSPSNIVKKENTLKNDTRPTKKIQIKYKSSELDKR